jgi:hypothetical protein
MLRHCRQRWDTYHQPDALAEVVQLCGGMLRPDQGRLYEACPLPTWATVALIQVLQMAFRDDSTTGPLRRLWKKRLRELIDGRRYDCVQYGLDELEMSHPRAGEYARDALAGTPAGAAGKDAMLASYHKVLRAIRRGDGERYLLPSIADQLFVPRSSGEMDQLMNAFDGFREDFDRVRAVRFLEEHLAAGELPEAHIEKARCAVGLSADALDHARHRLRVRVRSGVWSLPAPR